ncbi:secretion protein HlyD [Helicobacter cinaedi]|uniref:efflux RND transporter periplasmic adaptor subunit n=1 Tax=Helicobacter cinaedi TaxID=213 RepID=UPI001EEEA24F|nr:efflux RND transporter periplasmic adaptor subunit [Helicobacter cinaedi]BDB64598.1 secretion protein HlyD [Helicobacter cinaedi]
MNLYQTLKPKKIRKKLTPLAWGIIIVVLVAIVISSWLVWWLFEEKISFETTHATRGDIHSSISASGSLSPVNEVEIGSVISGLVLEVLVEENDEVKKGQILARINPDSINQQIAKYTAQLNSAKAQLKASEQTLKDKKWNYDRLQELYNATNGASPSLLELQNAKTNYTSAKSDVDIKQASIIEIQTSIESAKIDLKNSIIISPVDGIVLSRNVEVGQSVAASFQAPTLFKVAENLEEMQLYASISEADIGKVKEGQEVTFSVDAYPDRIFHAKVNRVNFGSGDGSTTSSNSSSSSASSSNIVIYRAKIEVDNKSLLLRPDMSATADIITAKAENALLVPSSALYFDLNKSLQKVGVKKTSSSLGNMFAPPPRPKAQIQSKQKTHTKTGTLWILKNGKAESVSVELGISNGSFTQILSGIDETTPIITNVNMK